MSVIPVLTDHLDYLQRSQVTAAVLPIQTTRTTAPLHLRRLWRIHGIRCLDKSQIHRQATGNSQTSGNESPVRLLSEDALIGLYGYKIPIAFLVCSEPGGVAIHLGSWSPKWENASEDALENRRTIVSTVLKSLYPAIELEKIKEQAMDQPPLAGLALGIPTVKQPHPLDGALPLDRLIRAMYGTNWACLVLAQPVDEGVVIDLRKTIINEMRASETAAKAEGVPSPLAKHYIELLQIELKRLTHGQAVGAWRTAVYLLGDMESYYCLASVWRGIYSGYQSLPEPISVLDSPDAAVLAVNWAMPDEPGLPGPNQCHYQHPFQYQTLLTSMQLAAYIHLPQLETNGFAVKLIPDFDTVPPQVNSDKSIDIGTVIHKGNQTATMYSVSLKSLTRHIFIPGMTGSGKTNTIKYLLKKASALEVPYMVIEPAKREYRSLLSDEGSFGNPKVFTLGDERFAPFRMNPFEVEKWPETSVGTHIDLLRSVFNASFGMWTPLPQVLEECLHRIYKDRGWDIVTNQNHRLADYREIASAFPTLSDLVAKINEVTKELGYDKEAEERVRASLLTRINSLRVGGKGCMLDVQRSLPMEILLKESIILELEGMGDDDDKAFIMGLLLIRLAEYRRQEHGNKGLQHLLVFEEAHRLLANVPTQSSKEQSNPRGKAVESFANMLSEIRSYGQGVIIADQVPVKLAPDVIKNTNLKIAHRVLAQDDRQVLAGSMAMNERQASALAILTIRKGEKVAEAAVFSEGDDMPVLVGVPEVEGGDLVPTAEKIRKTWEELIEQHSIHSIFQTYPTCQTYCDQGNSGCISARMISEVPAVQETFAMFILSLITKSLYLDDDEVPELFNVLFSLVKREILPHISTPGNGTAQMRCVLTHGLYQNMEKYGALYGWSFDNIEYMITLLLLALTEIVDENRKISHDAAEKLVQFCHEYRQQCQRVGPFYGCERVCQGMCSFRYHVKPFTEDKETEEIFRNSLKEDEWETKLQNLFDDLIDQILLPLDDKMNREQLILCFVIQMTAGLRDYNWNQKQTIVDQMVTHIMNIH